MEGELSKLLALRDEGAPAHDEEKKEIVTTEVTADGHGAERNLMNSYNPNNYNSNNTEQQQQQMSQQQVCIV